MMIRRKHEADARLVDAFGNLLGGQCDFCPERFEHVGAARSRRHAASPVFGDTRTGGRGHEHRGGRDVERAGRVAAGAAQVDQVGAIRQLHLRRKLAHDLRRGRDLADRFLLNPQTHRQRRDLYRRQLAAHQAPPQRQHFVLKDFTMLDASNQRFGRCYRHTLVSAICKKFFSIACPCSVAIDSG